mmetsp:Transcript_42409/g.131898  ORF Transcript_42409/g.131898 Transcript_42409/m.131898 type:complete len:419 (-) Transcript_42409:36-1292(-)
MAEGHTAPPGLQWRLVHPFLDSAVALKATGQVVHHHCLYILYQRRRAAIGVTPCKHIASYVRGGSGSSTYTMAYGVTAEHHAILDCIEREVIHYNRSCTSGKFAVVREPLDDFMRSFGACREIQIPSSQEHAQEVLKRARSRIGEARYSMLFNNCEHFAYWCFSGEGRSDQVTSYTTRILAVAGDAGCIGAGAALIGFGAPPVVAGLGLGAFVLGLGLQCSIHNWVQDTKERASARAPICVYNTSGSTIRAQLAISGLLVLLDAGTLSVDVPHMMDGELTPPALDEHLEQFTLEVLVNESGSMFSEWTTICERDVQRGDVLVYDRPGHLRRVGSPPAGGGRSLPAGLDSSEGEAKHAEQAYEEAWENLGSSLTPRSAGRSGRLIKRGRVHWLVSADWRPRKLECLDVQAREGTATAPA